MACYSATVKFLLAIGVAYLAILVLSDFGTELL